MKGYNDFRTTDPISASYLKNDNDGFDVTKKSHKKLEFRCPECGDITLRSVAYVTRRGFTCRACSSHISYPNRVMSTLLSCLSVQFEREMTFEWSGLKRYDFYINDISTIIEMNGKQHYSGFNGGSFISFEKIAENDYAKKSLAIQNGIKNYIEIDASVSEIDFVAKSIMSSPLADFFDLSSIDWISIDKTARHSQYRAIIDMFNDGKTTKQICDSLHIDNSICRKVLKNGTQKGDCRYSAKDEILKTQKYAAECRKKKVRCVTTGMNFDSVNEAAAYYGINPKSLSGCLTGRSNSSGRIEGKKLYWEYQ